MWFAKNLKNILQKNESLVPLKLGNLNAIRDWNHVDDSVNAIKLIVEQPKPDDWIIASGETHSVKDFIENCILWINKNYNTLYEIKWSGTGVSEKGQIDGQTIVEVDEHYFRPTEVDLLKGDSSKIRSLLGWKPSKTFQNLVDEMMQSDVEKFGLGK